MTAKSFHPLVTVIVTTKNNASTIGICLDTITHQTYNNIELIVVDNSSTDETCVISKSYTKNVFTKGPERSAQRNYAAKKAKGDFIIIIDSDMELATDVIEACVLQMTNKQSAAIIPEESFGIGFWAKCKALERSFYNGVDWIEAPRFFEKKLFLDVGGYDESIVGGEDWDLHVRIKAQTKIGRIKPVIRHNEGALTMREIIKSRKYYAKGFSQYFDKPQVKDGSKSGIAQAIGVYGLLLSQPKKLLIKPLHGIGVLFMKTVEFGTVGFILISSKRQQKRQN